MAKKKTKKSVKKVKKAKPFKFSRGSNLFLILGIASFLALIFMIVIFFNERLGITPWMSVIFLDNFTEGENWILFMTSIIGAFFIATLTLFFLFRKTIRMD